mgnify:CR=1 FL=1
MQLDVNLPPIVMELYRRGPSLRVQTESLGMNGYDGVWIASFEI